MGKRVACIYLINVVLVTGGAVTIHTDGAAASEWKMESSPVAVNLDWWSNNATNNENVSGMWQDASLLAVDLHNPRLKSAVKALSRPIPQIIRMGGTLGDVATYNVGAKPVKNCPTVYGTNVSYCLSMQRWDELHSWCKEIGCRIAFGLNALYGRGGDPRHSYKVKGAWDPSNAFSLLNYSASCGYHRGNTLFAWELGNELQDDMPAAVMAAQYHKLSGMIKQLWPDETTRPYIVGPDENPQGQWLHEFLQACNGTVDMVTYHQYSGFGGDANLSDQILGPAYWDKPVQTVTDTSTGTSIAQAFHAYQRIQPRAQLWVGETAAAWDSGKQGVTNAFVDSFWFMSQLGELAKIGVATQCRQTLVGGSYELIDKHTYQPNPDFYLALLWNRIMGSRVLTVTGSSHPLVRLYAHCSSYFAPSESALPAGAANAGAVAVAAFNAGKKKAKIDLAGLEGTGSRLEFRLTAKDSNVLSREAELNGKLLRAAEDGTLPAFQPAAVVNATAHLQVNAQELVFVVFPNANAASC